jgi:hypothetical protein
MHNSQDALTYNFVVDLVAGRISVFGTELDMDDVKSYVSEVGQSIINYCDIESVPDELKYVWASMTTDYLRWWLSQSSSPDSGTSTVLNGERVLSSISEGNVSLGFSGASSSTNSGANMRVLSGVLDKVVTNYTNQLNRFRRMSW